MVTKTGSICHLFLDSHKKEQLEHYDRDGYDSKSRRQIETRDEIGVLPTKKGCQEKGRKPMH